MKRWSLLFMPEQKHKKRLRAGERRQLAAAWRRTYLSLPIIFVVLGLLIYLAATTPKVGSPKDMVRAQLTRAQPARLKDGELRASNLAGAATTSGAGLGSTAANANTPPSAATNTRFEEVGFDRLGGFPINVTQLMYSSQNSDGQPSEVDEQIPEPIRKCDGQRVAVSGFMLPLKFDKGLVTEFLLLKSQALCCYGAIPRINEWIVVNTKGTRATMDRPIVVRGRLRVGETREDGLLTGIYRMEAE